MRPVANSSILAAQRCVKSCRSCQRFINPVASDPGSVYQLPAFAGMLRLLVG
jgi:hypothetical protein